MSEKLLSTGQNMPAIPKDIIEQEARMAAYNEISISDACPYPFSSEAALHFIATWSLYAPKHLLN